jgi:uncharacterized protein YegP (UPF0339 family)
LEKAAKFIVYRDFVGEYRWRLRSLAGETIAASEIGHHDKSRCAREMEPWKLKYPEASVRDTTVWTFQSSSLKN